MSEVSSLRQLNIAGNNLQPEDFIAMFDIMKPQSYSLSFLNLSWNSANTSNKNAQVKFNKSFADFLRHSKSLQHLDISGMGFKEASLEHIALRGIRKSKTLLAIHMSGNLSNQDLLIKMRMWLKVVQTSVDETNPYENVKQGDKIHEYDNLLH